MSDSHGDDSGGRSIVRACNRSVVPMLNARPTFSSLTLARAPASLFPLSSLTSVGIEVAGLGDAGMQAVGMWAGWFKGAGGSSGGGGRLAELEKVWRRPSSLELEKMAMIGRVAPAVGTRRGPAVSDSKRSKKTNEMRKKRSKK